MRRDVTEGLSMVLELPFLVSSAPLATAGVYALGLWLSHCRQQRVLVRLQDHLTPEEVVEILRELR